MSEPALYLKAAESLRRNPGQWAAYNSTGHCVVLAGPGSGKTKTLTIKMARILAEDVQEPRGVACITYNNECARELAVRLDALGVQRRNRVFIGTVHSFALTQIVLPYARTAQIGLPDDFRVATTAQQRAALQVAYEAVINRREDQRDVRLSMDRYRRTHVNRAVAGWRQDEELVSLIEAYERELRRNRLIDFNDMPLLALRALTRHEWLRRAILAKYPVLVVDEYQDLGTALHQMVMGLCFSTGIRLFAVGDTDQSIYSFTGANPALLERLSQRQDVETVQLRLNYRCGSRIVTASEYALGEDRGYEVPDGAGEGVVYFHPRGGGDFADHANHLFSTIVPDILARTGISPGQAAVLYPAAWIGDAVADAARHHAFDVIRSDTNALYPRGNTLMRWLESCAVWCCGGWRTGSPRYALLSSDAQRIFAESLTDADRRLEFGRRFIGGLWSRRDPAMPVHEWLEGLSTDVLDAEFGRCRSLDEERAVLRAFITRARDEDVAGMTLAQFAGFGDGANRINLSSLHSAKGREFEAVVLFGMNNGRIPRTGAGDGERREARRSFYVGFTRAKQELHMMYSGGNPSPFVVEVQTRLDQQ